MTAPPVNGNDALPGTGGATHRVRQTVRRALLPLVLIAAVVLALFAVEPVRIGSDSMAPTLVSGQRVVLDKVSYHLRDPRRDELVAFRAPDTGELTLKRVSGVAGDRVAIRDGVLHVNGQARTEPYVDYGDVDSVYFGPVMVPTGTVFLLGDNRGNSIDSRSFGPVSLSDLIGRVMWDL